MPKITNSVPVGPYHIIDCNDSLPFERGYASSELEAGVIYKTTQGRLAYAVTNHLIMLVDDPSADVLILPGDDVLAQDGNGLARFPFTKAPVGTCITVRRNPEPRIEDARDEWIRVALVRVKRLLDEGKMTPTDYDRIAVQLRSMLPDDQA